MEDAPGCRLIHPHQGAEPRDRAALSSGYVDVVVLRDVIARHAVSNPLALRWIERQLLANPGGPFSVKKHYGTLRSQGMSVGKDTLHNYLAFLKDAFLLRTVALHSACLPTYQPPPSTMIASVIASVRPPAHRR